jgi:hypothetical protein
MAWLSANMFGPPYPELVGCWSVDDDEVATSASVSSVVDARTGMGHRPRTQVVAARLGRRPFVFAPRLTQRASRRVLQGACTVTTPAPTRITHACADMNTTP